jgi:CRISPR/Cas system-associated endonuclease Cas3-HD
MASSTSLLANLHNKRMQIAASSSSSVPDFNTALLTRLRKYMRRVFTTNNGLGPTTRDILAAFQDVPDSQAATFRSLLKSIAVIDNGHWVFKKGQS